MDRHYTAFVTTDRSCLDSDNCDIAVIEDQIIGYQHAIDNHETPIWESSGDTLFTAETMIPHDTGRPKILARATEILALNGWHLASDWEAVITGYCATTTRERTSR